MNFFSGLGKEHIASPKGYLYKTYKNIPLSSADNGFQQFFSKILYVMLTEMFILSILNWDYK
jgi:hypothetical protein